MKLILTALTILISTISIASADCHGFGCNEFPSQSTTPQRCSAFGCPNRQATPHCRAFGCNVRTPNRTQTITVTGQVDDYGNVPQSVIELAKKRATDKAMTECGTNSITQISEWTTGEARQGTTFRWFTFATATFQCE